MGGGRSGAPIGKRLGFQRPPADRSVCEGGVHDPHEGAGGRGLPPVGHSGCQQGKLLAANFSAEAPLTLSPLGTGQSTLIPSHPLPPFPSPPFLLSPPCPARDWPGHLDSQSLPPPPPPPPSRDIHIFRHLQSLPSRSSCIEVGFNAWEYAAGDETHPQLFLCRSAGLWPHFVSRTSHATLSAVL